MKQLFRHITKPLAALGVAAAFSSCATDHDAQDWARYQQFKQQDFDRRYNIHAKSQGKQTTAAPVYQVPHASTHNRAIYNRAASPSRGTVYIPGNNGYGYGYRRGSRYLNQFGGGYGNGGAFAVPRGYRTKGVGQFNIGRGRDGKYEIGLSGPFAVPLFGR